MRHGHVQGTLKLASRDPGVAPLIDCNFLATGRDARRMLEGVKLARDASIIPETPSTVLNLTVMMLAERIYQRVYQAGSITGIK